MAIEITIVFEGDSFSTMVGFYDEVERKLTKGLDWKIGRNLDAFNDVLRGGFGMHEYGKSITITWINSEKSRKDLGKEETIEYLKEVLKNCHPSNRKLVIEDIGRLKKGKGKILFDTIVEITKSHEHVKLLLQ